MGDEEERPGLVAVAPGDDVLGGAAAEQAAEGGEEDARVEEGEEGGDERQRGAERRPRDGQDAADDGERGEDGVGERPGGPDLDGLELGLATEALEPLLQVSGGAPLGIAAGSARPTSTRASISARRSTSERSIRRAAADACRGDVTYVTWTRRWRSSSWSFIVLVRCCPRSSERRAAPTSCGWTGGPVPHGRLDATRGLAAERVRALTHQPEGTADRDARGGIRTHMSLRAVAFEDPTSALPSPGREQSDRRAARGAAVYAGWTWPGSRSPRR